MMNNQMIMGQMIPNNQMQGYGMMPNNQMANQPMMNNQMMPNNQMMMGQMMPNNQMQGNVTPTPMPATPNEVVNPMPMPVPANPSPINPTLLNRIHQLLFLVVLIMHHRNLLIQVQLEILQYQEMFLKKLLCLY